MIISHRHRFIFVKTLKTAGTSIEAYLSQQCGEEDVVTPVTPPVEGHRARNYAGPFNPLCEALRYHGGKRAWADFRARKRFYNHLPAFRARCRITRRQWRGYFKFCVERNPWDKTLSHYAMERARAGGELSFEAYLEREVFALNQPIYTDPRRPNLILVDRVLRYEELDAELSEVFGHLGIPFSGSLTVKAKSEYRSDRRRYQEVYTPDQRDVIARAFAGELALHGYDF